MKIRKAERGRSRIFLRGNASGEAHSCRFRVTALREKKKFFVPAKAGVRALRGFPAGSAWRMRFEPLGGSDFEKRAPGPHGNAASENFHAPAGFS